MNIFEPLTDDFQYILASLGRDITINDNPAKALITSVQLVENNPVDDKYLSTDTEISAGGIVEYLNAKWLVLSALEGQTIRNKGIMRKCSHDVKFNFQGVVKNFPTIIESKIFDVEEGKYFNLADGEIRVTLQVNSDSNNIAVSDRFIKMGSAWKVTGVDKTKEGLITLSCQLGQIGATDDMKNEIANYGDYTWAVTINNVEPVTLNVDDTRELDVTVKLNTEPVENASLLYGSNDGNICTVSNGIITAVGEGTADITVSLHSEFYSASDSIIVSIEEVIQDNFTIQISGQDSITIGSSADYTADVYNNGELQSGETVTWSLSNGNASITSFDGSSCTVQAGDTSGVTVDLIAILDSDGSVTQIKTLDIASLW